jgi:hypothetical protein
MEKSFGKAAYAGYLKRCGGKSLVSGAPLPTFDEQAPEIRAAWDAAAEAAINAFLCGVETETGGC